ncbi:hypothetical protein BE11_10355 [Sorangium cellulosum]|nr:hypothetical protein BE11_10355 [Sorangium cellulosum]
MNVQSGGQRAQALLDAVEGVGARALTGPTADPGRRVQLINAPGAEVGPGQVATWGVVEDDLAVGFDFSHPYKGGSSKHFPFDWRPE